MKMKMKMATAEYRKLSEAQRFLLVWIASVKTGVSPFMKVPLEVCGLTKPAPISNDDWDWLVEKGYVIRDSYDVVKLLRAGKMHILKMIPGFRFPKWDRSNYPRHLFRRKKKPSKVLTIDDWH